MSEQSARAVGLIIPGFFGFNPETSRTNTFQNHAPHSRDIHDKAVAELQAAYEVYRQANVDVRVFQSQDVTLPDAIFPNSVITFTGADLPFGDPARHYALLCPMLEESRQRERNPYATFLKEDLGYELITEGIFKKPIEWYERQPLEKRKALEGTGSLALDRINKIVYCALSPRSDKGLAKQLCKAVGYRLVTFNTDHDIYHTDLVIFIGTGYACICSAIIKFRHRKKVLRALQKSGLAIYDFDLEQFCAFCLNSREIRGKNGRKYVFMSAGAYNAFGEKNRAGLKSHGVEILHAPIPTIEMYGGGSGCCITQELHGLND
ncbi:MAG: arginine deiminase-related protein [Alphaproteobacteria bacterium]